MTSKKKIHFEISERKILLRFFDIAFLLLGLQLIGLFFDLEYFKITQFNYFWSILLFIYLLFFGSVFQMYDLQVASNQFQTIKSVLITSTITVLFYMLTPFITPELPKNRYQIVLFYFVITASLFIWRLIYLNLFASKRFLKRVILICEANEFETLVNSLQSVDPHYKIEGFVNLKEEVISNNPSNTHIPITLKDMETFMMRKNISEIVVASDRQGDITVEMYNCLIKFLENGVTIREYTQVYESITQRIPVQYVTKDFYKYFPFSRSNSNQLYWIVVRFFEIIFSLLGIILGLLLLPIILLGNFLGNKGNLFYTQERVGRNGGVFKIVKFRTMILNAEKEGAVFAAINDSRVTPFGRLLRKARLDEIPQFFNILKGDMSVIGPRPERPEFVKKIAEVMPFYETRHIIKPGLTGWAQVNYSYGNNLKDSILKLQYDLYYIKHRSIFLDINIIVKTIRTVLFFRGQ